FFFSSRRRHTRSKRDWSSDVCSSDLLLLVALQLNFRKDDQKLMSKEMVEAFATLEKEKGIKQEVIVDAIKAALVAAYKKNYNQAQNVEVVFDEKKGNFKVNAIKTVVDEVQDSRLEVSLKDALEINRAYEVGDEIRFEVTPKDFGRLAAQTAKQVIMQRLREA